MLIEIALLPFALAVVLLMVFRRNSRQIAVIIVFATVLIVLAVPSFRLSPTQIGLSIGQAAGTALTMAVVLFPALLFYWVQSETKAMLLFSCGLAILLPDRDLQTLFLVLGVGSFLETSCGLGTGAVLIVPLLARLYSDKQKVAILALLSQIVTPWGVSGMSTMLAADLSRLPAGMIGMRTALLLFLPVLMIALLVLAFARGMDAVARHWLAAVCGGAMLMAITCVVNQFLGVESSLMLASILVMMLFLLWEQDALQALRWYYTHQNQRKWLLRYSIQVLCPYGILAGGILATRLISPLRVFLQTYAVISIPAFQLSFAPFYSSGPWLLLAATATLYHSSLSLEQVTMLGKKAWKQFVPVMTAVICLLVAAALMQHSGMITLLGTAAGALGTRYIWIAPLVGVFSGWLTSSSLSGNALAVPMQLEVSRQVGLNTAWIIAAQNTAVSIVSMATPTRTLLIASTLGLVGQESLLLRKMGGVVLCSLALIMLVLTLFLIPFSSLLLLSLLAVVVSLVLLWHIFRSAQLPLPRFELISSHVLRPPHLSKKAIIASPKGKRLLVRDAHQELHRKRTSVLLNLLARAPQGVDLHTLQRWTGASRTALYQELLILQERGEVVRNASHRYTLHAARFTPPL